MSLEKNGVYEGADRLLPPKDRAVMTSTGVQKLLPKGKIIRCCGVKFQKLYTNHLVYLMDVMSICSWRNRFIFKRLN